MDNNNFDIGFCLGVFFMGIAFILFIVFFYENPLEKKCAETQGKYDFCVQKVSWEVKR